MINRLAKKEQFDKGRIIVNNLNLYSKCLVSGRDTQDDFVGIKLDKGLKVFFPRGYNLSNEMSDDQLRSQIFLLLSTINSCKTIIESDSNRSFDDCFETEYPFFSYLYVYYDFLTRGFYRENELYSSPGLRGKIDWKKTINNVMPLVQNENIVFNSFYTKTSRAKDDELFQLVQRYCVYLSFENVGCLFSNKRIEKPNILFDKKWFLSVVVNKLQHTFNDRNKELFIHMIKIINNYDYSGNTHAARFGTYRFEYVWETMIDKVFGIEGKEKYYPTTFWLLRDEEGLVHKKALRPDTIMVVKNAVFVLDSKYYKYGETGDPSDLPDSSSTHKQITYGEYISNGHFNSLSEGNYEVYNAFLLPFDTKNGVFSVESENAPYYWFGQSVSDWKKDKNKYERIQGLLVDTKHLLSMNMRYSKEEIDKLAQEIVSNMNH